MCQCNYSATILIIISLFFFNIGILPSTEINTLCGIQSYFCSLKVLNLFVPLEETFPSGRLQCYAVCKLCCSEIPRLRSKLLYLEDRNIKKWFFSFACHFDLCWLIFLQMWHLQSLIAHIRTWKGGFEKRDHGHGRQIQ